MKKYWNKLLVTVLAFSLVACGPGGNKKEKKSQEITKKVVKTEIISMQQIRRKIRSNSTFEPKDEVVLTAPAAEVKNVYFKNGERVKVGDLVVELKDETVKGNYLKAKAAYMSSKANYQKTKKLEEATVKNSLASAEGSLKQAKETYEKALRGYKDEEIAIQQSALDSAKESLKEAKFNYERNKKLYEEKLISESAFIQYETTYKRALSTYETAKNNLELKIEGTDEEDIRSYKANYEKAQSAYDLAKKNVDEKVWEYTIESAEANYLSSEATLEVTKKDYDDLTVESKINGVVSGLDLKKFEKTTNGQALFTVVDESEMEITAGLTASELIELDKNSPVDIYVDDLKETFKGKIVEIDPTADSSTNKFNVKVVVDNSKNKLKKGMYSKVYFYAKQKKSLAVPKEAIVIKDLYSYVFIADGEKAKRIRVKLGIATDKLQEIITDSIRPGDKIIVEGQFLLQDNEMIKEVK